MTVDSAVTAPRASGAPLSVPGAGDLPVDELCLAAVRALPADSVVQYCVDGDLDRSTLLSRVDSVRSALEVVGVGRGTVVALKGRRDSWLLPTLLGILGSGAAYTVIPFNSPATVERQVIDDLRPAGVLVWADLPVPVGVEGPGVEVGGPLRLFPAAGPDRPGARRERSGEDLFFVCSTSGSTGRPKRVAVPHRAVAAFLRVSPAAVDLAPDDLVAARSSAAFDLSVWELFAPLLVGTPSVLVVESVAADAGGLHELMLRRRCTVLSTTPSAAYQLGAYDRLVGGGLALRRLLVGGEPADGQRLADVMSSPGFRDCRLDNWYGPTEVTVSCTAGRLDADDLARLDVPIGEPLPGVRASIDGADGDDADVSRGELVVGGDQVAHGYLGDPRATASAFVPDPDVVGARAYRTGDVVSRVVGDRLVFLGRDDGQVQLRGYRLELTDVERAVESVDGVRWSHAAVGGSENDVLIAYYSLREQVDRDAMWAGLYESLPRHAVPAALVEVAEIPQTEGHKLAVDRLPAPRVEDFIGGGQQHHPATTPTELALLDIWRRLLRVDDIGINHHFFALGGHSLLITRLAMAVAKEFGVRLDLAELIENLTISELASTIDARTDRH